MNHGFAKTLTLSLTRGAAPVSWKSHRLDYPKEETFSKGAQPGSNAKMGVELTV